MNNNIQIYSYNKKLSNFNTQLEALKCITQPSMKELFKNLIKKFTSQKIIQDIQIYRNKNQQLDKSLILESNFINNTHSLYINYNNNNGQEFHFTIHLCPGFRKSNSNGLIHIKQNAAHSQQIYVEQYENGLPHFKLGKISNSGINNIIEMEGQIICDVLNDYMKDNKGKILSRNRNRTLNYLNVRYNNIKQQLNQFVAKTHSQQKKKTQKQRK